MIQRTNTELERENNYLRGILASIAPKQTRGFFICGAGGKVDKNGLPTWISICPAYGVDWADQYQKHKELNAWINIHGL